MVCEKTGNQTAVLGSRISGFDWTDITKIRKSVHHQAVTSRTGISRDAGSVEEIYTADLVRFLETVIRRATQHSSIWFDEAESRLGLDEALLIEKNVAQLLFPIVSRRITGVMGNQTTEELTSFEDLPHDKLIKLIDALCLNWLAADGIWFQSIESRHDMWTSKQCNDAGWRKFSPLEAKTIQSFLGLPYHAGLEELRRALGFRLCSRINRQTVVMADNSLILYITSCRVQNARKRKGMMDYPCRSAGIAEYSTFAKSIDSRIKTECLGCPPHNVSRPWVCGWKFTISPLLHEFDYGFDAEITPFAEDFLADRLW